MGVLSERARRRIHAGVAERAYSLSIGGQPYTDQVRDLSGAFDPKGGGSALSIQVRDSLEGLEDAPVELWLGYGSKTVRYFAGSLAEPGDLAGGKATAYGPFKRMTDQQLGETVTYQNVPLRFIFKDLEARAGFPSGYLDIIDGKESVENTLFTEETNLSEVAKGIADKNNYVFYDRPGAGRRLMPISRTGVGGRPKAHYTEANYKEFSVKETRTSHYSKVIVLRRNSAGGDEVRAVAPVTSRSRFKPPANRIYYVPDFPGTAAAAQQQAYEIAHRIAFGEYAFSLTGIWINPELDPWDTITVEKTERRPAHASPTGKPGKFLITYQCLINGGLSFQVSKDAHHMDPTGDAVRIGAVKLPDPIRINLRHVSAGTVRPDEYPGLKPNSGLKPRSSSVPIAGTGLYPSETLYPSATLYPQAAEYTNAEGLKPKSTRHGFEGGDIGVARIGGLKPNVGLKPNSGLKPNRSRLALI